MCSLQNKTEVKSTDRQFLSSDGLNLPRKGFWFALNGGIKRMLQKVENQIIGNTNIGKIEWCRRSPGVFPLSLGHSGATQKS